MFKFKNINKLILQLVLLGSIIFEAQARNFDEYHKSDKVSDYFSGIITLNNNEYINSYKFLKNLEGLEEKHSNFSELYLFSLINLEKFNLAYKYSKKLEKKKLDSFESNLIVSIYYLKNKNSKKAKEYLKKIIQQKKKLPFQELLSLSIYNLFDLENNSLDQVKKNLNQINQRYNNIKKIQNVFIHCYFDHKLTENLFLDLINDNTINFSRYNYFYINYLKKKNKKENAMEALNKALINNPRNLILNQYKENFKDVKMASNIFDCKNISDITAEIFYISSNALSQQSEYLISNFYLNLAKYLNTNFISFETLYAENLFMINNLEESLKIYKKIKKKGSVYNWYSSKQIAKIYLDLDKEKTALDFLENTFKEIMDPSVYVVFDYAEFLKNNKRFEEAIQYYSQALKLIDKKHFLYPEITDGRGIAFERSGNWDRAEKDLLDSLSVVPDQAYVINYLAYTWIEKGQNIEKSLKMLRQANELKKNDGYIIDSLGWALFKLNKFREAKQYLQLAVMIMPSDPVINDHYADSLWMNEKKIQARYYWNYVLNLKKTDQELRNKIKKKLINGPQKKI